MLKKILAAVCAAALCVSATGITNIGSTVLTDILSITASAEDLVFEDYQYKVLEDGNISITKYTGSSASVTIPSKINNKTVTTIGSNAFYGNSFINSVVIPDTVTRIEWRAFLNCINLSSVKLSDSLTFMGERSFGNCTSLASIEIPKSLETAETEAYGVFYNCDKLNNISFEKGIKKIPYGLFCRCTGLTSITIPDTVTKIDSSSFYKCTNLESVYIPDSVTTIDNGAFAGCTSLNSVRMSDSLTTIESEVFKDCVSLTSITIPLSLQQTMNAYGGRGTFCGCDNLNNIIFEEGRTFIPASLFTDCTGIISITLPDTVKVIEESAFSNCTNMEEITLPDGLEKIDRFAFMNCESLQSVSVPKNITTIEEETFNNCKSLTSITLPKGLTELRSNAFDGCESLEHIDIPDTVTYLADGVFANCSSLEDLVIPNSVTTYVGGGRLYQTGTFYNCKNLKSVTLPDTLDHLGWSDFENCESLTEIYIPSTVQYIGDWCFQNCNSLEKVTIATGVEKKIYDRAFANCESLTDIDLGNSVTEISREAFRGCSALEELYIPYSVKSIGEYVFADDTSLASVYIGRSVESIDITAFSYPKKTTFYGVKGTYAEEYANEKGIKFVEKEVPVTQITLPEIIVCEKSEKYASYYEDFYIPVDIEPSFTTDIITFQSSNERIFTVDEKGKVDIMQYEFGDAELTVTSSSGVTAKCVISVPLHAEELVISKESVDLNVGDEYQIPYRVYPTKTTDKITWKTSDNSIADVDENGNVTAIGEGTATITASTEYGLSAECKVNVKAVAQEVEAGTADVSGMQNNPNVDVTNMDITFTDDSGTAYNAEVQANGKIMLPSLPAGEYTVTASLENCPSRDYEVTVETADGSKHYQKCENCKYTTAPTDHEYLPTLGHNENGHWRVCHCGHTTAVEAHELEYRNNGDGTHYQVCKTEGCGYVTATVEHRMSWHPTADGSKHEGVCACGAVATGDHVYEDGKCTVCGMQKPAATPPDADDKGNTGSTGDKGDGTDTTAPGTTAPSGSGDQNANAPQTDDGGCMIALAAILAASVAGIVAVSVFSSKKKKI